MKDSPEALPIACNLDPAGLERRIREISALGAALKALELRLDGDRPEARLRFPQDDRERVERFVTAESQCCTFFGFAVSARDDGIELRIDIPREEAATQSLRGLAAAFTGPAPGEPNAR